MRRYPAYDPPEYLNWSPDPVVVAEFGERVRHDPERHAVVSALDYAALLALYEGLVRNRLHDITLKRWVRQGVLSKAWLGTGEEAVTIGSVHALDRARDVVAPMIRNAGACHEMGIGVAEMLRAYLGTADSPNGGRDLHFGDRRRGVFAPISHMGEMVPVMAGVALAFRYRREARVALTWIGDGATKTAECHEGLNLAAVLSLPVVFIVQNNQVALGTRLEQDGARHLEMWGRMYGVEDLSCDGNNVLDVYAAARLAADRCRRGEGPVVVVAQTFRMSGHATHDEREARELFPAEVFAYWGMRDPIGLYEEHLVSRGIPRETLGECEQRVAAEVDAAAADALASRRHMPPPEHALYEGVSEGGPLLGIDVRPVQPA
ncbi:MAG: thiamine pyrophosphate-dependent dehydrogenase E1 component subunit alpha [Gemmatimonadetes bacterium]|nr:thiamine pyrophosphate-dependent dehydrogenase E1 component subunit alpha [Gemmatimonadota bacterium]